MDNKEIVEILKTNGLNENIAQILVELRTSPGLTQREITERLGLYQSQVSTATIQAYRAGMIRYDIHFENNNGNRKRGRPIIQYYLKKAFHEVILDIAADRAKVIAEMMDDLRELKAVA
jgi:predicted transcriptional regulator